MEAGINLRANTAIFVTHNHINHCNDINAVINAMTYGGFDKKGVLVANKTVINGSMHYTPHLHKFFRDCVERFLVLEEGKKVGINDVEIKAIKAKHSEPNAVGFKFITPDYTLTYSGDTIYSVETVNEYENSNVLILNVPALKREESRDNLCKDDAIKIIKKVKPRLAIITHFGVNFLKADPLYEVREIQKQTDCQVIAARDGMIVNPVSYSVEQGQKTLYKYDKKEGVRLHEHKKKELENVDILNEMIERQTKLEDSEKEG
jgi:ribonuclease BN (tRNA processing enzyme)